MVALLLAETKMQTLMINAEAGAWVAGFSTLGNTNLIDYEGREAC